MVASLFRHDKKFDEGDCYDAMQAASDAYDATLAPVHTYFVRMAVKTSMYLLPDRATFIASIGETGTSHSCCFGHHYRLCSDVQPLFYFLSAVCLSQAIIVLVACSYCPLCG